MYLKADKTLLNLSLALKIEESAGAVVVEMPKASYLLRGTLGQNPQVSSSTIMMQIAAGVKAGENLIEIFFCTISVST